MSTSIQAVRLFSSSSAYDPQMSRGYDVIVLRKMRFTRPYDRRKTEFSKKSTLESVFKKISFWLAKTPATCGPQPKNLRFQKYPDSCGRSICVQYC